MDRPLPDDLVDWLSIVNGMAGPGLFGSLLPSLHVPLTSNGILRQREMLFSIYGRRPRSADDDSAGTPVGEWLEAFLPIADSPIGLTLYADLRAGERHGCICEWDPEAGGYPDAPRWRTVTQMLHEVAEAMHSGTPALREYADGSRHPGDRIHATVPEIDENGWLTWEPEPGS